MYKLVVVVRDDLKLSKGKLCAQVSHAVLNCFISQKDVKLTKKWLDEGAKKIVLKCKDKGELLALTQKAEKARLTNSLVIDAGLTEVPPGTATCLGIGPEREEKIDKITGDLSAL
ncbi:MAG: aminoacyl-tRNA hydrolase [Candidatus Altiarchaeota archaeon]|nr:aminoacyl-tRNA hydrolase [Candidatus Altiarchaeota archaeon]